MRWRRRRSGEFLCRTESAFACESSCSSVASLCARGGLLVAFNCRLVRLMAGVAREATRMLFRIHLWKGLRLGRVGFVALDAEDRGVGSFGNDLLEVGDVRRERSMAGLAVDADVLACFLE